ncbi:DNA polymerase [Gregarina niphandrodes]|uniref:DNA polymerase n=1 Tax=Gregarina niphandrodes TaxID=110365 RepID=A0A023AZ09_GRENI|nr:DNA polymerase [Gregarina niphandrodes]EZG43728.1 DNA polymerase [Gregarina niphandrodes]|eukprot:XP_011133037.1 DNA polymerase [Gregarina niphandrodes]
MKLGEEAVPGETDYAMQPFVESVFGGQSAEHALAAKMPTDLEMFQMFQMKSQELDGKEAVDALNLKGRYGASYWSACLDLCLREPLLTYALVFKLAVLPLTHELANISGCPWNRSLSCQRARRNEYVLMHYMTRHGYVYGTYSGEALSTYAGGLVLDPVKGLHQNYILYLDYASLYPSVIQEFNVDFTTVGRKSNSKSNSELTLETESKEVDLVDYSKEYEKGILPSILEDLVQKRRAIKARLRQVPSEQSQLLDVRQRAIKLIANSIYGSLGFRQFRFYSPLIAATTTAWGRRVLSRTKEKLESSFGCTVVYGDTDSLMIDSGIYDEGASLANCQQALNKATEFTKEINKTHSKLELEVECVFKKMLLLNKKKYAALKVDFAHTGAPTKGGTGTGGTGVGVGGKWTTSLVVKGVDIVRRDWCELTRKIGYQILDIVLCQNLDPEQMPDKLYNLLQRYAKDQVQLGGMDTGGRDTGGLGDFVIHKSVTKALSKYPANHNQPHVTVALRLKAEGVSVEPKTVIPYVVTAGDEALAARAYHPREVHRLGRKVDWHYYKASQIFPPVERLLRHIPQVDLGKIAAMFQLHRTHLDRGAEAGDEEEGPDLSSFAPSRAGNRLELLKEWSRGAVASGSGKRSWVVTDVPCLQCQTSLGQTSLGQTSLLTCGKCGHTHPAEYELRHLESEFWSLRRELNRFQVFCRQCESVQPLTLYCRGCDSAQLELHIDEGTYAHATVVLRRRLDELTHLILTEKETDNEDADPSLRTRNKRLQHDIAAFRNQLQVSHVRPCCLREVAALLTSSSHRRSLFL